MKLIEERNGIFYADATIGGSRIRKSLRTRDRDLAAARFAEFERTQVRISPEPAWIDQVEKARGDGSSWLRQMYAQATRRDRNRSRATLLTFEQLIMLLRRCGGRCELTGLPFFVGTNSPGKIRPYQPSLDRVDNSVGYTYDNCRIVCCCVNIALGEWGIEVFRQMAYGLVLREQLPALGRRNDSSSDEISMAP